MKKLQHGIALLELIIAIGILGILTAAVVILAGQAFDAQAEKDTVQAISEIRGGIQGTFRTAETRYLQIDAQTAEDARAVSPAMMLGPFGAKITLQPARYGEAGNANTLRNAFVIVVPTIPPASCTKLVSQLKAGGFQAIALGQNGSNLSKFTGNTTTPVDPPIDVALTNHDWATPYNMDTVTATPPADADAVTVLYARNVLQSATVKELSPGDIGAICNDGGDLMLVST